ncbi:MAG: alternative ribosome rescue aminoacyl-tRNA hydrolase ArfB [Planctomycetota bacterium]|nr:alternative ribosome rescue aminoacyl-tRNA hydrolase ArfB [Planctomycetota bacterium]
MLRVTGDIVIDEREIHLEFIRASGPGGQNVNKVASAVQLRFDVRNSPSLPEDVRRRLTRLAGRRISDDGMLIIDARRYRTQMRNRRDAIDRLVAWVCKAAQPPKIRRKTTPTSASKERRLESKRRRSQNKQLRSKVDQDE